jgi:hypothetical protein
MRLMSIEMGMMGNPNAAQRPREAADLRILERTTRFEPATLTLAT